MRPSLRYLLLVTSAAAMLLPVQGSGQATSTGAVAERYLALTFNQEYDALLDLYARDATFFDPTGEVFSGPVADGPIRGADAIVALQKSWGLQGSEFDVDASFSVGEYSLHRGSLRVRYDAGGPWIEFPFVTVLRVRSGRVVERTDFGAYVEAFQLGDRFRDAAEETRAVSAAYLRAYLDEDLDAQRRLLSADAQVQDPTAQVYGPDSGQLLVGADQILRKRAQTFKNVTDFGLEVSASFVSCHHAVYMGTTKYTLRNGARYEQPAVFVIEVRDGHVTRHWDFVDYSVGPVA